jgi:RNA polymerase sigma-70 factor (ECF subfamily)
MNLLGLLLALELGDSANDQELARRLQRREPQAMADLYDRFGRLAYSLIFSVVREASIAEDLVQETFLRVWNRAAGFDPERGALGPWLLAVARNRAIDHIRSARAKMDRNVTELDIFERTEHGAASNFVDMERDVLNADSARRIKAAMSKLSQNHQKVIELAYYEGLSQTEMAARLGQPLGTVKTWVRTALKHLKDELGGSNLSGSPVSA